jgi:sec-independent protein translocase protein TatB
MFDVGFSEMILLAVIALIAIGPKQLPEVARMVARFINDVKRITSEFTGSIVNARDSADQFLSEAQSQLNKSLERSQKVQDSADSPPPDPSFPYKPEAIVPPPFDGPIPEPDLPSTMTTHSAYKTEVDGEPEQLTMPLDDSEKSRGSSGK